MSKALRYAVYALAASGANLLVQELCVALYHGAWQRYAALAAGTVIGLLIKYGLDSLFIFKVRITLTPRGIGRFMLYGLTGAATTALFWAVELSFIRVFAFAGAATLGGAVGLAAGYTSKYFLDSWLVFRTPGRRL